MAKLTALCKAWPDDENLIKDCDAFIMRMECTPVIYGDYCVVRLYLIVVVSNSLVGTQSCWR